MAGGRTRVLIAKPGLDGHDVGAKVIVRALMDAGFEVIYTGLKRSPEEIVAIARDEDVDVIGLSILSGSHLPQCRRIGELIRQHELGDKLWIVGGNIPARDHAALDEMGVAAVFPVGTPLGAVGDFIKSRLASTGGNAS
jgi:methylmalonyl-CoA mutase C-terminal domain/subunit